MLHAYLSFLVHFLYRQRASIKGKAETKAEAKAESEAEAVAEVASQASDTMSNEKNEDTKKVCVFVYARLFLSTFGRGCSLFPFPMTLCCLIVVCFIYLDLS